MIMALAERLQRTQSDAVRFVIREAMCALPADPMSTQAQPAHDREVISVDAS